MPALERRSQASSAAVLVLIVSFLSGCKSPEQLARAAVRRFLPERTVVIYYKSWSAIQRREPADQDPEWGYDSLRVTLREGNTFFPSGDSWIGSPWADTQFRPVRLKLGRAMRRGRGLVVLEGQHSLCLGAPEAVSDSVPVDSVILGPNPTVLSSIELVTHGTATFALRIADTPAESVPRIPPTAHVSGRLWWGPLGLPTGQGRRSGVFRGRYGVVNVAWSDRHGYADSNGFFRIDSLVPGPVQLDAFLPGMAITRVVVNATVDSLALVLMPRPRDPHKRLLPKPILIRIPGE